MTDERLNRTRLSTDPEEKLDAATLAAFLDGRLSSDERERVLERLVDDEDARRILLDASEAMHAESGAADDVTVAVSHPPAVRSKPGLRRWIPWSVAAVLVIGSSAVLLSGGGRDTYLLDPTPPTGRPALAPSWGVQRGAAIAPDADRRAYRIGATIVRLRHAWSAGDESAATERNTLAELLGDVAGSTVVLGTLGPADRPPAGDTPADAALSLTQDLRSLLDNPPHLDLGIWTEQLRQATNGGDRVDDAGVRADAGRNLADRFEDLGTDESDRIARLLREAVDLLLDDDHDVERLEAVVDSIAERGGG